MPEQVRRNLKPIQSHLPPPQPCPFAPCSAFPWCCWCFPFPPKPQNSPFSQQSLSKGSRERIQGPFTAPGLGFSHPGDFLASLGGVGVSPDPPGDIPMGHFAPLGGSCSQIPAALWQGHSCGLTAGTPQHPAVPGQLFLGVRTWKTPAQGHKCNPLSPLGPSHHLHSSSGMQQEIKATGDAEQSSEAWKRGMFLLLD